MNFSVNFLLYCVSGRNFRLSVKKIFCRMSSTEARYPKSKCRVASPITGNHSPVDTSLAHRGSLYPPSITEMEYGWLPSKVLVDSPWPSWRQREKGTASPSIQADNGESAHFHLHLTTIFSLPTFSNTPSEPAVWWNEWSPSETVKGLCKRKFVLISILKDWKYFILLCNVW